MAKILTTFVVKRVGIITIGTLLSVLQYEKYHVNVYFINSVNLFYFLRLASC